MTMLAKSRNRTSPGELPFHTAADPHSQHPSSKLGQTWLATEGALFISAQLPTDGEHLPKGLGTNKTVEAA